MMFNLSGHNSIIDKNSLIKILDNTISPKVQNLGLIRQDDYLWYSNSTGSVRKGLEYLDLKGGQATLKWGVCFDFIPTYVGNALAFYKTAKQFKFHLFEWPDEYSNSFFGGNLQNAVSSHWGKKEAEKSIKKLFERNEGRIFKWFDQANTLDSIVEILLNQIQAGRQYNFHSPSPKYVLAFLYAKTNQYEKAVQLFDSLDLNEFGNREELRSKARRKLIELSEKKNGI